MPENSENRQDPKAWWVIDSGMDRIHEDLNDMQFKTDTLDERVQDDIQVSRFESKDDLKATQRETDQPFEPIE